MRMQLRNQWLIYVEHVINERFFNELLGTSIEDSLFETNLDDIASFLEREITVLLKNYEPRITLLQCYY